MSEEQARYAFQVEIVTTAPLSTRRIQERLDGLGQVSVLPIAGQRSEILMLDPQEVSLQRRLDRGIGTLFPNPQLRTRLSNRLSNKGYATPRDLLVVGEHGLGDETRTAINRISEALQASYPEIPYQYAPDVTDIAAFCLSLDQVHAGVLPSFRLRQRLSMTEELRDEAHCREVRYARVSQLLDSNNAEGLLFLLGNSLASCISEAQVFAQAFKLARQQKRR